MIIFSKKIILFVIILLPSALVLASCPKISFEHGREDYFKSFLTESQVKEAMSLFNDPNMDKKLHKIFSEGENAYEKTQIDFTESIEKNSNKPEALKKFAQDTKNKSGLLGLMHTCDEKSCLDYNYRKDVAKQLANLMNKQDGQPISYMSIGSGTLLPDLLIIHQALQATKANNISLKIYLIDKAYFGNLEPSYAAFNLQKPSFDSIDEMIKNPGFEQGEIKSGERLIASKDVDALWYWLQDLIHEDMRLYKFMSWLVWTAHTKLKSVELYGCGYLDLFIIDNKQPRSIDILVGMNLNNQYAQQDFDRARNQVLKPGGISVGGVKSPEKFSYANAMNTALQTLKKVFDELNKAFFKQTK